MSGGYNPNAAMWVKKNLPLTFTGIKAIAGELKNRRDTDRRI